jgi:hypothetical protein
MAVLTSLLLASIGQELDVNLLSRDEVASLMKAFIRELPQPLFFAVPAMQWIATRTFSAHILNVYINYTHWFDVHVTIVVVRSGSQGRREHDGRRAAAVVGPAAVAQP